MSEDKQPLKRSIEITVDGKPFEVFMSFALLNRCAYLMGDSVNIPFILQDPELREAILVETLAIRDAKGKVTERRGVDEVDVSFEDIQNVLEFVSEHVSDFTIAAVEKANKVMLARKVRIDALNPSTSASIPTGSGPSA